MDGSTGDQAAAHPPAIDPLQLHDPPLLGRYRLTGRIAEGGMGVVYLGRAPDGLPVAVKTVRPSLAAEGTYRERFRAEAAAAARVVGFWTARVLHADTDAPIPYLVTEYVPGPSLEDRVRAGGPLAPGDVESLAAGVATALTAIHRAGVVHRDLKPANVILSPWGPRVVDFGIARPDPAGAGPGTQPADLTRVGEVIGTPGWMAPELLRGAPATAAADVFAWACLVLFAAEGRPPFGTGAPAVLAYRVLSPWGDLTPDARPDPRRLTPRLAALVPAAMDPDPSRRPGSHDLLSRLLDAAPQAPTLAMPAGGPAGAQPVPAASAVPPTAVAPRPAPTRFDQPAEPAGYAPPPSSARKRRRALWAVPAAVAAVLLAGALRGPEGNGGASPAPTPSGGSARPVVPASRTPAPRATPRPSARPSPRPSTRPAVVAAGERALRFSPARAVDGDVHFSVRRGRCGVPRLGTGVLAYEPPRDSALCVLEVEMRNRGTSAHFVPSPELIDDAGRSYAANALLALLLDKEWKLPRTVQPGERVTGPVVWQVPRGTRVTELNLKGDLFTPGARLRVR